MRIVQHVCALLLLPFLFLGCREDSLEPILQEVKIQQPLMGTLFQVKTYSTDIPKARRLIAEGFEQAVEIEKIATDYDPSSELNQLSAMPHGIPVPVSDTLFELLRLAKETAEATDGAYDPTLGPLTRLWRETRRSGNLPEVIILEKARQSCGHRFLILDAEQQTVTLAKPNMQLDLGGIAKGYAADHIFNHLNQAGLTQTLVAAGGDLRFGAAPPDKSGWTIGLRTFHLTPSSTKNLVECAVSTSGDLHQSVTIRGKRYAHLIDHSTGLGLTTTRAATVIAPLASMTDPLATAACLHPNPDKLLQKFPQASFRILSAEQNIPPVKSGQFLEKNERVLVDD